MAVPTGSRAQFGDQAPQPLGSRRRGGELVTFDRVRCRHAEVPSLAERPDVLAGPPDDHRRDVPPGQPGEDVAGQGEPLGNAERLARLAHRHHVAGHPTQFRDGRCSCPGHQAADHLAESALTISPPMRRATSTASTVLPVAVGPPMARTGVAAGHPGGRRKMRRSMASSNSASAGRPCGQVRPPGVRTRRSSRRC